MKRLFIILSTSLALWSCTKNSDALPAQECGHVQFVTRRYNDDQARMLIDTTITYQTDTCGTQFENWKLQAARSGDVLTSKCVNGETLWYEMYVINIKQS